MSDYEINALDYSMVYQWSPLKMINYIELGLPKAYNIMYNWYGEQKEWSPDNNMFEADPPIYPMDQCISIMLRFVEFVSDERICKLCRHLNIDFTEHTLEAYPEIALYVIFYQLYLLES